MNALRDVEVGRQAGREFNRWLLETCCNRPPEEAAGRLVNWQDAPSARYPHPREEHLLPLHVCLGAALSAATPAKCAFNAEVMGYQMSAFLWD